MRLFTNALLCVMFNKFMVVVQIMGTMEDERTFNNMTFYEDKLYNKLCEHLDLVVHMYAQPFYAIYNYPYHI